MQLLSPPPSLNVHRLYTLIGFLHAFLYVYYSVPPTYF